MKGKNILYVVPIAIVIGILGFVWYQKSICVFAPNIKNSQLQERSLVSTCSFAGSGYELHIKEVFYTNTEIIVLLQAEDLGVHKWFMYEQKLTITAVLPELPVRYVFLGEQLGCSIKSSQTEEVPTLKHLHARLKTAARVNFKFKLD